jgi:hypothetical protein
MTVLQCSESRNTITALPWAQNFTYFIKNRLTDTFILKYSSFCLWKVSNVMNLPSCAPSTIRRW